MQRKWIACIWLKNNAGKSYREAITAYYQILKDKKKGKSLEDAIKCWKYKKKLQGHNRYDRAYLLCDFKQQGYTGNIKEKLAERAI